MGRCCPVRGLDSKICTKRNPLTQDPRSDVPVSGVLRAKSFGAVQSAECAAKRAGESEISPW